MKNTSNNLTNIAMIASVYTVVSLVLAPISFGNIQIRIAEGLVLLPLLSKHSIYGVVLGCFLTNLIGALMGVNILGFLDVFIGTFATLIAAYLTYHLKDITIKNIPVLSIMMPVIINGLFIGLELGFVLFPTNILIGSIICGLEVAIGELVAVLIGYIVIKYMKKLKTF